MKRIEFSKLILMVIYITAIVFTAVAGYLTLVGKDANAFAPIVLAIWAQLGTSSGFYYWKAKSENKIKLLKSVPDALAEAAKTLLDRE